MTYPTDILEKVRAFAGQAHGDQMRKYSHEPYIHHLVRVMKICREYTGDLQVLAAALLHDVLEDTPVTANELGKFLSGIMEKNEAVHTLKLVEELTDVFIKDDYPNLNRRARKAHEAERLSEVSPEAQTIKYADVLDNVENIAHHDRDFALVYIRESKDLLKDMKRGDPRLYERVTRKVDQCLKEFWSKANIKAL